MSKRKKSSLVLRYHKACQAALRKRCVAWFEDGDTCIVNMNNGKVHRTLPEDLFNAITDVPYRWSIHLVIAGKQCDTKKFTKGSIIQTTVRYYAADLIEVVNKEFNKLENNFNKMYYHRKGYVAVPRIEDLSEEQVEIILDRIGIWNHEN